MKNKFFLLMSLIVAIAFAACSKDDSGSDQKSKTNSLTSGSWKVSAFTVSPAYDYDDDGDLDTDLYAIAEPCEKENKTTYKADGSYIAETTCDNYGPQKGTWKFANNGTELTQSWTFEGESVTAQYRLLELSNNVFKFSFTETDNNVVYTYEVTCKK